MTSLKLFPNSLVFVIGFALTNVLSFGVGHYWREDEAGDGRRRIDVSQDDQDAKSNAQMDALIASWTHVNVAAMAMTGNDEFRFGYFNQDVRALADTLQARYNVPSGVALAQFALESRFGLRDLGAKNYFGHTYPMRGVTKFVTLSTREYVSGKWIVVKRRFARYKSINECFDSHGRLLVNGYSYAFAYKDNPEWFADAIAKRYATDPIYSTKLKTIMRRYKL